MSDLTFNKIAGAVLATGLAIFLLREVSEIVFHQEELEKPGYAIDVTELVGAAEDTGPELPPDWGTLIPAADPAAGKAVAVKCVSCHTFEQGGANGTGPNLYGVLGARPGAHAGFAYSPAMADYAGEHPAWGWDNMDAFLEAPQRHIPGTKMTFVGLKQLDDRVSMLAYLHSLGSSLAVPAPNPAPVAEEAAEGAAESADQPTSSEAAGQPLPGGPGQHPVSGAARQPTQTDTQTRANPQDVGG